MSGLRPIVLALAMGAGAPSAAPAQAEREPPPWQAFVAAASADRRQAEAALAEIAARWSDGYTALIVDLARLLPSPRGARAAAAEAGFGGELAPDDTGAPPSADAARPPPAARQPPGADARRRLTAFLERQTGQRFGDDLRAWRRWMWQRPYEPHPEYAAFKAHLYARIDPAFARFFPPRVPATIRLDEIDWGGVRVNGIPPLRSPRTVAASAAPWLRDGHIVFGVVVNGEARAYPKRILAWHELATDRVGGVDLAIVYCTLCGTVIPYEAAAGGRRYTFGTSGLLYRSNKLMFDDETGSLWSSMEGVPVVGPLAGSGTRLRFRSVVTTTWGEWRRDHPATTVLSLATGFERDYAEGQAYRDYFATDRLMFEVPADDRRLKNKAEVLVLRPEVIGGSAPAVAVAVDRLRREPIYTLDVAGRRFVVVTSAGGANRVYDRGAHAFVARDGGAVLDGAGRRWTITTDALVSETGERLPRVPSHRAFWFGWVAQHPDTLLFK